MMNECLSLRSLEILIRFTLHISIINHIRSFISSGLRNISLICMLYFDYSMNYLYVFFIKKERKRRCIFVLFRIIHRLVFINVFFKFFSTILLKE